jgi:hypothetical protein
LDCDTDFIFNLNPPDVLTLLLSSVIKGDYAKFFKVGEGL